MRRRGTPWLLQRLPPHVVVVAHAATATTRLLIKQRGRNLGAGQAGKWTPAWFHDQGLHQLMGTIRYPKTA